MFQLLVYYFVFNGKEYQNYIEIFGIKIMFYAISIVTGMIVCMIVARPAIRKMGLDPDIELDMMVLILPLCIICARLWYVIFELDSYNSFWDLFNTRNGGLAIYGGVMGGALAEFIVGKIKKIPFTRLADIGAMMLPLGQAFGRWGNFFNQEVYGRVTDITAFPLSVYISSDGCYHYALFFYESVLNLCLFTALYLFVLKRKGKTSGYAMAFYFMGYGLIRAILEPLRDPKYNLMIGPFRSQVITSIVVILIGIITFILLLKKDGKLFFKKPISNTTSIDNSQSVSEISNKEEISSIKETKEEKLDNSDKNK